MSKDNEEPQSEIEIELPPKFFKLRPKKRDQILAIDPEQLAGILGMSLDISCEDYVGEIEGIAFQMIVPKTSIIIPGQKPQPIPHVLIKIKWRKEGGIKLVEGKLPT
jgi:hypothetical protein